MATSDDLHLSPRKEPRLCFLNKSNRRKVIDDNSQRLSPYHTHQPRVSSGQVSDPAKRAASSTGDLTHSTGQIQVKGLSGRTKQHQSDEIKMNKGSSPLVKKSGINAITPVPRLCKQKQETQPPKDPSSLVMRSATSTIPELKELTLDKDPSAFAKGSAASRSRTLMPFMKKKVAIQLPRSRPYLLEHGGTSRIVASKNVKQKNGTAQPPKYPAGLVKKIGTSRISASMHNMQKKKITRIPALKQFTQKGCNDQSSKGRSGLVSKSETDGTLLSKLDTYKKETIPAKPRQEQPVCEDHIFWEEQRFCEYHIVWEGFDERILPLGKSCLLCEGDLANEMENDPDVEPLNPAGNAVLSCGHAFHSLCLLYATSEEKSTEPPCVICASFLS